MKRWKHPNHIQWKKPTILVITSLFMVILLIPTLIVIPFTQKGGEERKSEETGVVAEPEASPVTLEANDSPFSIKVYRSDLEQAEMVPLEDYVARVVASEMPVEFEMEALKAQALAARTYIVNLLILQQDSESELPGNSDVTDNPETHQVYKNDQELKDQWGPDYNRNMNKINQAVASTTGEIITYQDQPITPAFFSTSNGYTENSEDYWSDELPYLRSVESPWDQDSPKFIDQKIVTADQVEQALGVQVDPSAPMDVIRTESNRVEKITIGGKEFTGRKIRTGLGLRSTDFEVEYKNDHYIFTTRGYGHGVGMSQYGADGMAKEGKGYKEILTYYYKDAEINNINSTAPQLASIQNAKE